MPPIQRFAAKKNAGCVVDLDVEPIGRKVDSLIPFLFNSIIIVEGSSHTVQNLKSTSPYTAIRLALL